MKRVVLLATMAMFLSLPLAGQGTVIAVYAWDDVMDVINPSSAAVISSQALTVAGDGIDGFNGLAQDPTTGTLYGVVKLFSGGSRRLCTINRATGVVSVIGPLGDNVAGIQFHSNGTLYAVTGDGAATPETLYTVNKATGAMTLAFTLGNGDDGEAIGFNPLTPDVMYHCSGFTARVFETVNLTNGATTNISNNIPEEVAAMAYDSTTGGFITTEVDRGMGRLTTTGTYSFIGFLPDIAKGIVVLPRVNAVPTILDLGTTDQGTASTPVSFTLTGFNLFGDVAISTPAGVVVSLSQSGGFGSNLNVSPAAGGQLSATTVYVRMQASAPVGPISGNLTLTAMGADTVQVAVSGQVNSGTPTPDIEVLRGGTAIASAGNDNLGDISVGAQQSLIYVIENNGTDDLALTGTPAVSVTPGANVQGLTVSTQPATTVAPAGSTSFTVDFEAPATGAFSFTISLENNVPGKSPFEWTVSGNAQQIAPQIQLMRTSITIFQGGTDAVGNREVGDLRLVYTIRNNGTGNLTLTLPVTISNEVDCTAAVTTSPAATVPAGGNTSFTVDLTTTQKGPFSFVITILSNDPVNGTFQFTVAGEAIVTVAPKPRPKPKSSCSVAARAGGTGLWLAVAGVLLLGLPSARRRLSRRGRAQPR
jgi:trimeric autotransporter adhesin